MQYLKQLTFGFVSLFTLIAMFNYWLINALAKLSNFNPRPFWELDFRWVSVLTLLLLLLGVSATMERELKN